MSEPLLHSAIRTLVSTCQKSISICVRSFCCGLAIHTADGGRQDTYPEIFDDSIYFDVRLVVSKGVLELRLGVSKTTETKIKPKSRVDIDRRKFTYLGTDGINT
jgi:hypothetical protein